VFDRLGLWRHGALGTTPDPAAGDSDGSGDGRGHAGSGTQPSPEAKSPRPVADYPATRRDSEYGSADDPDQFRYLYAYSPYHHVEDGRAYPPLLMLAADSDDRIDPMHARKFTARLQAASTGGPVWMRVEKNAGHGGADLVRAAVDRQVDTVAWLLAQIGGE
jgi:hypothetical protein